MGVMLDLNVLGAELLDAVVFAEKSPAMSAFSDEIVKILADFNKTGKYGFEINIEDLAEHSAETLTNMQRAFLYWTFKEDKASYGNYLKLFCKSQEKYLLEAAGGKSKIFVKDINRIKEQYLKKISSDTEAFNSVKDFFAGYIYGYFFNYFNEQAVMKDYANFIVCMGIMSNKIPSTDKEKQKILPNMSKLLGNDRFKYVSGELPLKVVLDIIEDRFELVHLDEDEYIKIRSEMESIVTTEYEFNTEDNLAKDSVIVGIMEKLGKGFVRSADLAKEIHRTCFAGTRTFTDGDRDDTGAFTPEYIAGLIDKKCKENFDSFYSDTNKNAPDYGLGGGFKEYKYPIVLMSEKQFCFSELFLYALFPALHGRIYTTVEEVDLPLVMFPFAADCFKSTALQKIGSLPESATYIIRQDKSAVLDELTGILSDKKLSDKDKKMAALEKLLVLVSGNIDTKSYEKFLLDNVFETKLFENYVRYRIEMVLTSGLLDLNSKKTLLNNLNKIS
ncbi:MAG: hypothetical protein LBM87_06895 [Ruminococcus sp.]|jgi:hypothetical protein|nr:hypothetical protein [Ruminococcus sp.]